MTMLVTRLSFAFFASASAFGEQACTSPADRVDVGDAPTALLQTQVDLTVGGTRKHADAPDDKRKPSAQKAAKHERRKARGAHAHKTIVGAGTSMFMQAVAEFLAMTLYVFLGCGCVMAVAGEIGYAWVLQVSLTFGLAIAVLSYTFWHYSGAQINCAVTLGMIISGHLTWAQGGLNLLAQLLGSLVGSVFTRCMFSRPSDKSEGLGTNAVAKGFEWYQALLGEFICTFFLMLVVLEVALDPATASFRALSCLAIGFAVFLAHSVLVPIDGCSINPTRSFGPAVIRALCYKEPENSYAKQIWIFWVGPLLGATAAAFSYNAMRA